MFSLNLKYSSWTCYQGISPALPLKVSVSVFPSGVRARDFKRIISYHWIQIIPWTKNAPWTQNNISCTLSFVCCCTYIYIWPFPEHSFLKLFSYLLVYFYFNTQNLSFLFVPRILFSLNHSYFFYLCISLIGSNICLAVYRHFV